MKTTLNQRSFAAGEISPDLYGRTDVNKYNTALKKTRNVFTNKRGALLNAPGTALIMPGKFPTKKTKMIPFKISFNQQYLLIFGDNHLHFIKNGVPIFNFASGVTVTSFPNANN